MSIFTGSAVALITPFHDDGSVDYETLDRLIEWHLEHKTDAFVICGTTGESATLTEEEHSAVIAYAIKKINHRVPVIAGTGANDTRTAIELSVDAEKAGADALLLVTPYYNKATQKGLKLYFKAVAEAVNIPIILYNVPSRTGCNITPKTAVELAREVDNIVAIKEASGNISQIAELMALAEGCLDVYSGNDDQIVPILSLGGKGVISVLANVAPEETHNLVMTYLEGNPTESARIQLEAFQLIQALFVEVNPIPVKHACAMMGFGTGFLRSPLCSMEEANEAILRRAMVNYGLIKG